jgi:cell division transport system ATP-binding protein
MLELRSVSKVYGRAAGGRVEALADLTFEVKPTELAVVVGPVGAGKSTLLRLVTGEERPTRGAVLVDGVEVGTLGARGLARLRRSLGIVSQDGQLLPDRTALGNLTFVLRALGTGRAEARDRALAALIEVGLGPTRNALPHELAVGERRRVLLARALTTRPRLLLADEPTALLDAPTTAMVGTLLRSLPSRGTTCLVATQSIELARALEGRVLQLAAGRLRPEGEEGAPITIQTAQTFRPLRHINWMPRNIMAHRPFSAVDSGAAGRVHASRYDEIDWVRLRTARCGTSH